MNFSISPLISGNTAGIRAHTISGFIDLSMAAQRPVTLEMKTITGTMYSNFDLADKTGQVGGRSLSTVLNGSGGKAVNLETISGDIFLRKEGQGG